MTELMIEMTSWLVAAMVLGFIVAWLLSKEIDKRKQKKEKNKFLTVINERNGVIEKLEQGFRKKETMLKELTEDFKKSQEELAIKTSRLTTLQNEFNHLERNQTESLAVKNFQKTDAKRLKELSEFEEVLILAESKIDENEEKYRKKLKSLEETISSLTLANEKYKKYKKTIASLEEELLLYRANSSDVEFIISKDQFVRLENQLRVYQEEINALKNKEQESARTTNTFKKNHSKITNS